MIGETTIALGVTELVVGMVIMLGAMYMMIKMFIKREFERLGQMESQINTIQSTYVSRIEFNDTVKALRHEIRDGNSETHRRLDRVIELTAEKKGTS